MPTVAVAGSDHLNGLLIAQALTDHGSKVVDYVTAPALEPTFSGLFPGARRHTDAEDLAATTDADIVVTAAVPHDRAGIIAAALGAGHDVIVDRPMCTTLDQLADLRMVLERTGHRCLSVFSDRFNSRSIQRLIELVREGAVGDVVDVVGFAPNPHLPTVRPGWFYEAEATGGILAHLGAGLIDQFLTVVGELHAEIRHASAGNAANRSIAGWNDHGSFLLDFGGVGAFGRVGWLSPPKLPAWGDHRLFVTGTEGTIEARPFVDVGGEGGPDHVFLVNDESIGRIDCHDVVTGWVEQLLTDLTDGTEHLAGQQHCLAVTELALSAQAIATETNDRRHSSPTR